VKRGKTGQGLGFDIYDPWGEIWGSEEDDDGQFPVRP
jgi:hypothetical protein